MVLTCAADVQAFLEIEAKARRAAPIIASGNGASTGLRLVGRKLVAKKTSNQRNIDAGQPVQISRKGGR